MTGFKIYDMSGISATVMKLKLINAEVLGWLFGLNELSAVIRCIKPLETLFIDLLDYVFVKPGDICYVFIGMRSRRSQT